MIYDFFTLEHKTIPCHQSPSSSALSQLMSTLDNLKELLKGRNTEAINTFITKNPIALDEVDENGISGLMYIGYHQLPEALAFAIDKKADFTLYEAAAMGQLHR